MWHVGQFSSQVFLIWEAVQIPVNYFTFNYIEGRFLVTPFNYKQWELKNHGCFLLFKLIVWIYHICSQLITRLSFPANWIKKHFETPGVISLTDEERRTLLARLIRSTQWVYVFSINVITNGGQLLSFFRITVHFHINSVFENRFLSMRQMEIFLYSRQNYSVPFDPNWARL